VYNLTTGQSLPLQLKGSKALWDLSWSPCGRFVGGIGKDGLLSIWEPRAGAEAIVVSNERLVSRC
jgi:WD40 repeat protein